MNSTIAFRFMLTALLWSGLLSCGFAQQTFRVSLSNGAFQLEQSRMEVQRLDPAVVTSSIGIGPNGILSLSKFSIGSSYESWLGSHRRPIRRVSASQVLVSGNKVSNIYEIQNPAAGASLSQECQDVVLLEDGTEVIVVLPIAPIGISLAGEVLKFSRDTIVEMNIAHDSPVYLLTCHELLGNESVAVMDSGMTITILVDNIFDPKVYYPSAKMSMETALVKQWKKEVAQQENQPTGDCVEVIDWQDQPQIEVNMADGNSSMQIVCNRYLLVHTPNGDYCVDLVTCGAYFKLSKSNSKVVEVRTACPKLPTSCVGN